MIGSLAMHGRAERSTGRAARTTKAPRAGRPIVALAGVLTIWLAVRVIAWDGGGAALVPVAGSANPVVAQVTSSPNAPISSTPAQPKPEQSQPKQSGLQRLAERGAVVKTGVPIRAARRNDVVNGQTIAANRPRSAPAGVEPERLDRDQRSFAPSLAPRSFEYPVRVSFGQDANKNTARKPTELARQLVRDEPEPSYPVRIPLTERSDLAISESEAIPATPAPATPPARRVLAAVDQSAITRTSKVDPARYAAGHQVLFLAAMARAPIPPQIADAMQAQNPLGEKGFIDTPALRRWSLDAWVFARQDADLAGFGPRPGTLGASQAGYVARFNLTPNSRHALSLYTRFSKALIDGGETETAIGAQVRPYGPLPVTLHAEARATRVGSRSFIRPAAFLTTGFYDVGLPFDFTGRGYAQGGYVGGDFATGFFDAQLLAERRVTQWGGLDMRLGAGTWGSAQQGAHRIDVGPLLSYGFELGDKPMRLQADYRWRVAGEASPGDGAAVTLSTSF